MADFNVSCILPVINETFSLAQTIAIIEEECHADIHEYLIVVSDARTKPESMETIRGLCDKYPGRIQVHHQKMKFLGGAIREAFTLAKGTHTVMMGSDLETDPHLIKEFIRMAKQQPDIIITGTRWVKGGGFEGYNPVKFLMNAIFQKIFSLLYRTHLTDMTYGFRIFPTALLQRINWEELKHPFLFETVLKPLRMGIPVKEIPCRWEARKEGESQNPFINNFIYFRVGVKVLLMKRDKITL
jgi:hypothetical protein